MAFTLLFYLRREREVKPVNRAASRAVMTLFQTQEGSVPDLPLLPAPFRFQKLVSLSPDLRHILRYAHSTSSGPPVGVFPFRFR
jgi:hypothetical protein